VAESKSRDADAKAKSVKAQLDSYARTAPRLFAPQYFARSLRLGATRERTAAETGEKWWLKRTHS